MAVTSKPKSIRGKLTTTLTSLYTPPAAVPSDWGAGYASAQLKHMTISNGLTTAATSAAPVYISMLSSAAGSSVIFLPWYSIPAGGVFDWEGTDFLSTANTIYGECSSDVSTVAANQPGYHISVVEFTS